MRDDEGKPKKIAVRLPLTLYRQVMDKARRESVNLSAFLRAQLRAWVETEKDTPQCQGH